MKLIEHGSPVEDPEVLEYIRCYRVATELHIPPDRQDDQPAVKLDWLLHIHEAIVKRQNEAMSA